MVALLVGQELFVANAGDSRAVLSRGGEVSMLCYAWWIVEDAHSIDGRRSAW